MKPALASLLVVLATASCRSADSERGSVDAETIAVRIECPDARWIPATGWGVRCELDGPASIHNGSDRDVWYLGDERAAPVLFVIGRAGDEWKPLPSNVDTPATKCAWYRLAPGATVVGPLEAFADPQPVRIRFRASFAPPAGDKVDAFDATSAPVEVPEAPAR